MKDGSGEMWGVLVVAEPLSGDAFDEESLETFRSVVVPSLPNENTAFAKAGHGLSLQSCVENHFCLGCPKRLFSI